MDLGSHVDLSGSEDGTETDTHGEPTQTQDGNKAVLRGTEVVQETQGDESGGGY